jgi:hypothetical protein
LNRDLWRDDTVKEIIKANFVFLQVYFDTVDGKKLIHYYNISTYPFIAILDPRTGEKVANFTNVSKMDQCMFCEKVTNFLAENELDIVASPVKVDATNGAHQQHDVVQIDEDSKSKEPAAVVKSESKKTNLFQDPPSHVI